MIVFQRKKASARKVIKNAKKGAWREVCSSIGRETQPGDVWRMLEDDEERKDSTDTRVS